MRDLTSIEVAIFWQSARFAGNNVVRHDSNAGDAARRPDRVGFLTFELAAM